MKRRANKSHDKTALKETTDDSEGDLSDDFDNNSDAEDETTTTRVNPKAKALTNGQPPQKMAKLSKAELYKPPTNEELNSLKEAENLFHSSLFRMQITELLNEVHLKEKWRNDVDEFLHQLKDVLLSLPSQKEHDITDQKWVTKKKFSVPILQKPLGVKGIFRFKAPVSVRVMGSYLLHTTIRPGTHVDIALQLPPACLQPKDYMNQRYLRKRALYLTKIAILLNTKDIVGKLEFTYHHGNHMKPILVITPKGKLGTRVQVHVHTWVDEFWKLNRFHIQKNNVRTSWYQETAESPSEDSSPDPSTPHYNTAVLEDLVMLKHLEVIHEALQDATGITDGITLLKVWLHQRQISKGYGGFSGFIMSMLVVHLLQQRKLNRTMSSYQVVRNVLLFLSQADWSSKGITMATSAIDMHTPTMEDFHEAFDVVFVDPSGYVNLCATMTKSTYQRVRHEAELCLKVMDTPGLDGFEALFMKQVPFLIKFDQVFHVSGLDSMSGSALTPAREVLDRCTDRTAVLTQHLLHLVDKAMGCRLKLHAVKLTPPEKWAVTASPPPPANCITIGLLLDPDTAGSAVDKGPVADSPEAAAFREFWGTCSELRRFQDGTICEAAVWKCSSIAARRKIPLRVIKHILKRHSSINWTQVKFVGTQLDTLLTVPALHGSVLHYDTGEEQLAAVLASYDHLTRVLRGLKDLPLAIHSIQGVASALRYADTFPPLPVTTMSPACVVRDHARLVPKNCAICPPYTPAVTVQCILEGSGKWPEDANAVRRLRAAFHIQLARQLTDKHGLLTYPYPDHALILKDGLVFRVQIGYMREATLLRMVKTTEGMLKIVDTDEALAMERQLVTLPKMSSALHGLQQEHPSYSAAVRLVKRWVAAQLLADCLPEEALELLTAFLYLQPAPFSVPGSPLVAFQRWLNLVGNHDWKLLPVIVNLNNELTKKDCAEIESHFTQHRSTLPVMFIANPYDRLRSSWTRHNPTAQMACRLVLVARESLTTLEAQLSDTRTDIDYKLIFRPPLNAYNVLIHLKPSQLGRRHLAVDTDKLDRAPKYVSLSEATDATRRNMPVVDYDPVQCYLKELREAFDNIALFFYDPLGGRYIAVLWKQPTLQPQAFKVSQVCARAPDMTSCVEDVSMVPNLAAIMEDFSALGAGLVAKVEQLVSS